MRLTAQQYADLMARRNAKASAKRQPQSVREISVPTPCAFAAACLHDGIELPAAEYRFHPGRQWRFDWAWPGPRVALEVQGGIWTKGRHVRGAALLMEWEKLNEAACLGWRVLFCQPSELLSAATLDAVKRAVLWTVAYA